MKINLKKETIGVCWNRGGKIDYPPAAKIKPTRGSLG
jgi:hypothetical protein